MAQIPALLAGEPEAAELHGADKSPFSEWETQPGEGASRPFGPVKFNSQST
jgi:hypothetical protein